MYFNWAVLRLYEQINIYFWMYSTCVYVHSTESVFLQVCVCRLWRVKAIPLPWWSCPTWNMETCTAICSIRGSETVLWLVSLRLPKPSTHRVTRAHRTASYNLTVCWFVWMSVSRMGSKVQNRCIRRVLLQWVATHTFLTALSSWKHKITCLLLLSTVLLSNGWCVFFGISGCYTQ